MAHQYMDIAATPSVRAAQAAMGSEALWASPRTEAIRDRFGPDEAAFIAERDSFFMATVSETGWPYVQHRGGPQGFVRVLDEQTLAFADYRGNRQYISLGNLSADDRASLILVDYAARRRLKIYAHVETVSAEADPALAEAVATPGYRAKVERIFRLRLAAFDWNCPQHIVPRFTEAEVGAAVAPLRARLEALEAENAALRERLRETN